MKVDGRTRVAGIAAAIVAITATAPILLAACGGETAAAPQVQSNAGLLKTAVANMKAAKTYHLDVDLTQNGQEVKLSGDVDLAASNLKLSMNMAGQSLDVVKDGNDYYSSADGGKTWARADPSAVPDFSSFYGMWNTINLDQIDQAGDRLKDGNPPTEQVDGAATRHMTGSGQDLAFVSGAGNTGSLDFWVTIGDRPTVRQMRLSGNASANGTFKWSNVDLPVKIAAPSKTAP